MRVIINYHQMIVILFFYIATAIIDSITEKYLVVKVNGGLSNQLIGLANAIKLAAETKRSLLIDGFLPDCFNPSTRININLVIDCIHLQNNLLSLVGVSEFPVYCIEPGSVQANKTIPYGMYLNNYTETFDLVTSHSQARYLAVPGPLFLASTPLNHGPIKTLIRNIKFKPIFYQTVDEYIKFNLTSFAVTRIASSASGDLTPNMTFVHLRMEDDMLIHMHKNLQGGVSRKAKSPAVVARKPLVSLITANSTLQEVNAFVRSTYDQVFTVHVPDRSQLVYVCSGLEASHQAQMNDDYLANLRKQYSNLVFVGTKPKLFNFSSDHPTRELDAIFDLIMVERYATSFIGTYVSTFSFSCANRISPNTKVFMFSLV